MYGIMIMLQDTGEQVVVLLSGLPHNLGDKQHNLGDKVLRMSEKSSTFAPDLRKPLKTRSIGTILLIRKVECASYFCRGFVELLPSFYRAFAELLPSFYRAFTEILPSFLMTDYIPTSTRRDGIPCRLSREPRTDHPEPRDGKECRLYLGVKGTDNR